MAVKDSIISNEARKSTDNTYTEIILDYVARNNELRREARHLKLRIEMLERKLQRAVVKIPFKGTVK